MGGIGVGRVAEHYMVQVHDPSPHRRGGKESVPQNDRLFSPHDRLLFLKPRPCGPPSRRGGAGR